MDVPNLPAALDGLVAALVTELGPGVPVTRDPGTVRAHLAGAGVVVYVRPPNTISRTHGGEVLDVPVSVLVPATDSMADNDRAYPVRSHLLIALGEAEAVRGPVTLGPDVFPAHTITARIGASHVDH